MKASVLLLALPTLAFAAYSPDDYADGRVHDRLMSLKNTQWDREVTEGKHDSRKWQSWKKYPGRGPKGRDGDVVRCKNGLAIAEPGNANQTFRCNNVCARSARC